MASVGELLLQGCIGLTTGTVGAVIGARTQLWAHREKQKDDRLAALWGFERALRITVESIEQERQGGLAEGEFRAAWDAVKPYLHTLPDSLRLGLDEEGPWSNNPADEAEFLWNKRLALTDYLKANRSPWRRRFGFLRRSDGKEDGNRVRIAREPILSDRL